MPETTRLVTADELERFPRDDRRYELVEGRLVRMTPVSWTHGSIVIHFGGMLDRHVRAGRLGAVLTELGVKLRSNPDTVRAPDISFIRQERIPSPEPRGFWIGPPDLAVEVLSPDDRASETRTKVHEYLACGVSAVVVIDPESKTLTIHRPSVAPLMLRAEDDVVALDDVVPDFCCTIREIFE